MLPCRGTKTAWEKETEGKVSEVHTLEPKGVLDSLGVHRIYFYACLRALSAIAPSSGGRTIPGAM